MGLFNIFRRRLSPEELEEKSRKEQEWAQKCYEKGERFAEKMRLGDLVNRVNRFANKYPKSFLAILFGTLICSSLLNLAISKGYGFLRGNTENLRVANLPADTKKDPIQQEMEALYFEMQTLDREFSALMEKDPKNAEDTVRMYEIYQRMLAIERLVGGEEEEEDIPMKIQRILQKGELTAADSAEINRLLQLNEKENEEFQLMDHEED